MFWLAVSNVAINAGIAAFTSNQLNTKRHEHFFNTGILSRLRDSYADSGSSGDALLGAAIVNRQSSQGDRAVHFNFGQRLAQQLTNRN